MLRAPAGWFSVHELAPGLWGIGEFSHHEEVLAFLLCGEDEALLIDTGLGFFSLKALVADLTELPLRVVNTHSHFDHIGSNHEFERVALYDHPLCRQVAANGMGAERLARWAAPEQFFGPRPPLTEPYIIPPFPYATFFGDKERLSLPPYELELLHTPGHSDDSVSLYDYATGWLFPGDLIYDGPIFVQPAGGWRKYRRSIARLAALPGLRRIFPSHNGFELTLEEFAALQRRVAEIEREELAAEVSVAGRMRLVPR